MLCALVLFLTHFDCSVEGRPSTPSVSNFRHRYNTYHGSIADDMIYNDMATTHHHPIEPDSNLVNIIYLLYYAYDLL